jgi:thiamine biosynthesis lipoprotein
MIKVLLAALLVLGAWSFPADSEYQTIQGQAQGTTYKIVYRTGQGALSKSQVDSVLRTIDRSLSLWEPTSLINTFNSNDREVTMDSHMSRVVSRALEVSGLTYGSFDITIKPFMDAWGLGVGGRQKTIPDADELIRTGQCVGFHLISIRGRRLIKKKPCTQIDANGIAQGYSVDVIASLLDGLGIRDYLVELGGEIRILGKNPNGKPWTIGVEAAAADKDEDSGLSATLQPGSGGITTAGNYRKYVESGGKRFSHIMDPRTGMPVSNGIVSVTVRASNAMDADAWDDALFVLGLDSSFQLLSQHPEIQARFLLANPDGSIRDTASTGFFQPFH